MQHFILRIKDCKVSTQTRHFCMKSSLLSPSSLSDHHHHHHRHHHRHYHHHHQSRHLCIKSASRQTFAHAITRSSRQAFVQFHKKEQICIFENVLKMYCMSSKLALHSFGQLLNCHHHEYINSHFTMFSLKVDFLSMCNT